MYVASLIDPTALAIVAGGTMLAVILRTPARDLRRSVSALRTLGRPRFSAEPLLDQLAAQGRIARRHGVLALDRSVILDPDLAAGISAIVDGAGADTVAAILEQGRRSRAERHVAAVDAWRGAAEAAPAMGMIGTLIGLAAMFATMTDPKAIGAAMAIALLATLYGAVLANLVLQPIAQRLLASAQAEASERTRLREPLMQLAAREAPRARIAA